MARAVSRMCWRIRVSQDYLVCPGRRPTTGSRQKYSAAKTEVASESLPVAPFARPAPTTRAISLAPCEFWVLAALVTRGGFRRGVMHSNLGNKRL